MAGGEGYVDWTCKACKCHRYSCIKCGAETIGDEGEEMCERCFRDLVGMDGVVRTLRDVLTGDALDRALAGLRRDFPNRFTK